MDFNVSFEFSASYSNGQQKGYIEIDSSNICHFVNLLLLWQFVLCECVRAIVSFNAIQIKDKDKLYFN